MEISDRHVIAGLVQTESFDEKGLYNESVACDRLIIRMLIRPLCGNVLRCALSA